MTLTTPDVFDSPIFTVLIKLAGDGFRFRLEPDGRVLIHPIGKLPPDVRALFQQHPNELKTLVAIATDAGVHVRRDAFRVMLDSAAPGTLPGFLFTPHIPYAEGTCFSCGDALPVLKFARCRRCSIAWRLACRLPVPMWLAEARDCKVLA